MGLGVLGRRGLGEARAVPLVGVRDQGELADDESLAPDIQDSLNISDTTLIGIAYYVYFEGGPGHEAPRPTRRPSTPSWLDRALREFRVLMLDQRGTGRSTPVGELSVAQEHLVASPHQVDGGIQSHGCHRSGTSRRAARRAATVSTTRRVRRTSAVHTTLHPPAMAADSIAIAPADTRPVTSMAKATPWRSATAFAGGGNGGDRDEPG
jgi:hypothetical protein